MPCLKCGNESDGNERFCRKCGTDLERNLLAPGKQNLLQKKGVVECLTQSPAKDPDELTANGIGSVIVGDGFFMIAVILSATQTSVSSLLWLLLLIPAFFFFGMGVADVLHARQIRWRQKQNELNDAPTIGELPPPRTSIIDIFKSHSSGELIHVPSVSERTTRQLE